MTRTPTAPIESVLQIRSFVANHEDRHRCISDSRCGCGWTCDGADVTWAEHADVALGDDLIEVLASDTISADGRCPSWAERIEKTDATVDKLHAVIDDLLADEPLAPVWRRHFGSAEDDQ